MKFTDRRYIQIFNVIEGSHYSCSCMFGVWAIYFMEESVMLKHICTSSGSNSQLIREIPFRVLGQKTAHMSACMCSQARMSAWICSKTCIFDHMCSKTCKSAQIGACMCSKNMYVCSYLLLNLYGRWYVLQFFSFVFLLQTFYKLVWWSGGVGLGAVGIRPYYQG